MSHLSSKLFDRDRSPTAISEKDLGNEYFKQKKYSKAIECYSSSIALSPTSVAFANRAMAYLKIKRYEEAEDDCTEALYFDDRYVKAYSRRATARKELGKLKASIEDSEFALRLQPKNQELEKLYNETKALYNKEMFKKITSPVKSAPPGIQITEHNQHMDVQAEENGNMINLSVNGSQRATSNATPVVNMEKSHIGGKNELRMPLQEVAARAAAHVMANTTKNVKVPKSAYEFEVTWRALSEDSKLQADLLKSTSPGALPQLFKNALSAPVLVDIVKSITIFCKYEPERALSILNNLTEVSRFDMIVLCLSPLDRADFNRIWNDVFTNHDIPVAQREAFCRLKSKFCPK